jgi:hypothetical protein
VLLGAAIYRGHGTEPAIEYYRSSPYRGGRFADVAEHGTSMLDDEFRRWS